MNKAVLGARLKALRIDRNFSQAKIAELFDVSQQAVAGWEKNRTQPSISTLIGLADFYQKSIDYLVGRTDD